MTAATDHGVFYVENHGVPEEMMKQTFDQTRAFFDLDVEEKLKLRWNKNKRGYKPVGEEMVNEATMSQGGTKEVFEIWRETHPDSEEARKPIKGPNQWPAESLLPGWKATMMDYFDAVNTLAEKVFVLLAVGIDVDPAIFKGRFSESMTDLRLMHYLPKVSYPEQGVFGIGEHTDFGGLTVLNTNDTPGLEVLVNDEWIGVPPRPGAFICNIGDMLQRWTNNHLHSTMHRVVNKLGRERYSIAAIASPDFDTEVVCLPQFCSEDNPAKYPPSTCGIHLLEGFSKMYNIDE